MTPVGFEPTQLALVELESTPLDHSGKVSWWVLQVMITPIGHSDLMAVRVTRAQYFIMDDVEMVPRGLEPRTLRLLAVRSNQPSYETEW